MSFAMLRGRRGVVRLGRGIGRLKGKFILVYKVFVSFEENGSWLLDEDWLFNDHWNWLGNFDWIRMSDWYLKIIFFFKPFKIHPPKKKRKKKERLEEDECIEFCTYFIFLIN